MQSQPGKIVWEPYLENNHYTHTHTHTKAGGVAQGVDSEFKPQYWKKYKVI
jgi:hypothetical protein